MTIKEAIEIFTHHLKTTVKKITLQNYSRFLQQFQLRFPEGQVDSMKPDDVGNFLEECTARQSRSTRHLRYVQMKLFFNYVIEVAGFSIKNPCDAPVLFKAFKSIQHSPRKILDKETIDEIIFNARSIRDRLILELQARCGLRVGEVLKLHASDITGRKLLLQEPKSGRDAEVAFIQ